MPVKSEVEYWTQILILKNKYSMSMLTYDITYSSFQFTFVNKSIRDYSYNTKIQYMEDLSNLAEKSITLVTKERYFIFAQVFWCIYNIIQRAEYLIPVKIQNK